MLPFVLVLFVAASALAAPQVLVQQVGIQETSVPYDTGVGINRGLSQQLFELIDGADQTIHTLTLQNVIGDLAGQPNSYSQAVAVSQILAVLGELIYGIPGDACAAATAINASANNGSGKSYLNVIANNIDVIAQYANNPTAFRNSAPRSGGCAGRSYQFEAAWNRILDATNPNSLPLVNEEYCVAKRLYNAYNVRSNNVGAAATAAALPGVVSTVQRSLDSLVNFLRAAANGGNVYGLAQIAKQQLLA